MAARLQRPSPSDTVDDAPLSTDAAATLMGRVGFVSFRTPPGSTAPDSCLMLVVRDKPTLEHFDPDTLTFWVADGGSGERASISRATRLPVTREVSWGRVEVRDRFGASNSFVTFGGHLRAESIGEGLALITIWSPAPILRLRGHSQRQDELAEQVVAFFARLLPHFWDSISVEQRVNRVPPEALWAAFLVDELGRLDASIASSEEITPTRIRVRKALRHLARGWPNAIVVGTRLLHDLWSARRRTGAANDRRCA
jgi:hypothetical protein